MVEATELDRFPVSGLTTRYNIRTSAVYNRMKAVGIQPLKAGRNAYLNAEQLRLMDLIQEHLNRGGVLDNFPIPDWYDPEISNGNSTAIPLEVSQPSSRSEIQLPGIASWSPNFFESTATLLLQGLRSIFPPPISPAKRGWELSYLRELEEACEKGWLVSTENLANLLDVQGKTIARRGYQFMDAGFLFTRVGKRANGQLAWRVSRLPDETSVAEELNN